MGFESLPPSCDSDRVLWEHPFVRRTRFTEEEAREAIAAADSWAGALRLLGMRVAGGNHKTIQKWASRWQISTDHFDPGRARARANRRRGRTLEQMLVPGSNVKRARLKQLLYEAQGSDSGFAGVQEVSRRVRTEVPTTIVLLDQLHQAEGQVRGTSRKPES